MGEIRIPVSGQETSHWSNYMGQKLEAVVRDWVDRVEHGHSWDGTWHGTNDPISTEHLKIAKAFLNRTPAHEVDQQIMPPEVQAAVDAHLQEM